MYPSASRPIITNSKKVLRFYGDGAVTKILLNPQATPAATDNPTAEDLPLPLAAVNDITFLDVVLFIITSTNVIIARA